MLLIIPIAGLGASGKGGARAGTGPEGRADPAGEAGTDGAKIRQEGGHEGNVAPGEPKTSGSGQPTAVNRELVLNVFLFHLSFKNRSRLKHIEI